MGFSFGNTLSAIRDVYTRNAFKSLGQEVTRLERALSTIIRDNVIVTDLGADPTAQVTLTTTNGVLMTYMRSDAAPALSQAISPTMTGTWGFSPTANTAPVTVNKTSSLTSADVFRVLDTDGSYFATIDNLGLMGINVDPDAVLTVQGTPNPPIASPAAWFYAGSLIVGGSEPASGTSLTTWDDSSGNGHDLTAGNVQSGGAAGTVNPKYFRAGHSSATTNLPCVDFSATTSPDNIGFFTMASQVSLTNASGWTVCMIVRNHSSFTLNNVTMLGVTSADLNDNFIQQSGLGSPNLVRWLTEEGASSKSFSSNYAHTDGNDTEAIVLRSAATAGTLRTWVDGTLQSGGDTRTSDVFFKYLGRQDTGGSNSGAYQYSLAEMLIYDRALTDLEVATVNTYLLARIAGTAIAAEPHDLIRMYDKNAVLRSRFNDVGYLGIGVDPSYPVDVIRATATQARVGYDTSNYFTTSVASTGAVVFDAVGSAPTFRFSDYVGVGTTPAAPVHVLDASGVQQRWGSSTTSYMEQRVTSLVGEVASVIADNSSAVAFQWNDTVTRTTGRIYAIQTALGMMNVMSWDGRLSFGIGSAEQVGTLLGFNTNSSATPAGAPIYIGIAAAVGHSDAAETVPRGPFGVVGTSYIAFTAGFAGLTGAIQAGVVGVASVNVLSGGVTVDLPGKNLCAFASAFGQLATSTTTQLATKDPAFAMGTHPQGGADHITGFWASVMNMTSASGIPTVFPDVTSSARLCIQDWGAPSTNAANTTEYWAVYGENVNGSAASFPAVTGYLRMPYPRRTGRTGVRAMQQWWEPWPNTSTIRGGNVAGDMYFDDGTNFATGLWERDSAGWVRLLGDDIVFMDDEIIAYDNETVTYH